MRDPIKEEIQELQRYWGDHILARDIYKILDRYEVVADETIEDKVEQWARLQDKMRPWVFHRGDHILIFRERKANDAD